MTYSIVARDAETGELGVGVQSQAFNTGAAVPWARPGVGAVATQSFTDRRYGWRGLELLASGRTPEDVLSELTAVDDLPGFRQVGMIDKEGRTAQFTGEHCIPHAGDIAGAGWAAQGNMLAAEAWHEMGRAFEETRAEAYREANRARPAAPVAAARGLPSAYVKWLSILDAAGAGDVAEGRRLLAELVAEQPHWRDGFRSLAHHPEMPPLQEIVDD